MWTGLAADRLLIHCDFDFHVKNPVFERICSTRHCLERFQLPVIKHSALLQLTCIKLACFYCIVFDLHTKTPSFHGNGVKALFVCRLICSPSMVQCIGLDLHVWWIWWVNSKCSQCFGTGPFVTQFSGLQSKLNWHIKNNCCWCDSVTGGTLKNKCVALLC